MTCGNNISGSLLFDVNSNGCDINDIPIGSVLIRATDGTTTNSTFSDALGQYDLNVYAGNHTIAPVNVPIYFITTPANANVNFTGSGASQVADFCMTGNPNIKDLNVVILPLRGARPGFDENCRLIVRNLSAQTVANATVNVTFDDTKQTFVNASPLPSSTTNNQLNFDIVNMQPFGDAVVNFTMNTLPLPTVNIGDTVNYIATVTPVANDYTPFDNTTTISQTVVNSYDPNDKQVLQGDVIDISEVNEYLHYLIRFQNTGTASAINVKLKDILDSTVDWNTLQMINASHNYRTKITDGNKLEFIFDNINLPHEAADTAGSHGFIAYKVKPRANTQVGDFIIGNEVRIYFDYNLPIITNAVSTEVTEETPPPPIGLQELDLNKSITVYPNPAEKEIYIRPGRNIGLQSATIYSMDGRVLFTQSEDLGTIDIGQLNQGIYIIRITTNLGTVNKKIIKVF